MGVFDQQTIHSIKTTRLAAWPNRNTNQLTPFLTNWPSVSKSGIRSSLVMMTTVSACLHLLEGGGNIDIADAVKY